MRGFKRSSAVRVSAKDVYDVQVHVGGLLGIVIVVHEPAHSYPAGTPNVDTPARYTYGGCSNELDWYTSDPDRKKRAMKEAVATLKAWLDDALTIVNENAGVAK